MVLKSNLSKNAQKGVIMYLNGPLWKLAVNPHTCTLKLSDYFFKHIHTQKSVNFPPNNGLSFLDPVGLEQLATFQQSYPKLNALSVKHMTSCDIPQNSERLYTIHIRAGRQ